MKPIIFALLVIPILVMATNHYAEAALRNHVNAWSRQRITDFRELEDNILDILFVGSSHSYCTFSPTLIDEALGTESYQFGMPLQFPDSTYFQLRYALRSQSPSVVVMEVYWSVMNRDFDINQADLLICAFNDPEFTREYINEIFPWNERIKYAFPIIRHQQAFLTYQNNQLANRLEAELGITTPEVERHVGTERFDHRGFMWSDYNMLQRHFGEGNQYNGFDGRYWEFSEVQLGFLERIIQLCRDNDISLIFVTAPVAPVSLEIMDNYMYVHNTVREFAESHNIPYLDFNIVLLEEGIFTNENFRDDAHLNFSGAEIACAYFVDWIRDLGYFN